MIIGYTWCGIPRNYSDVIDYELYAMYILPEYWHQGIGTQLFNRVLHYFHTLDYKSRIIWALSQNSACNFYRKMGGVPKYRDSLSSDNISFEETGFVW
ncbi:GNAT family N-acetyltransferase [Candidatus Lokiarchaeum ossiferum]|uniref:GNAT family N-acetyltransferase n=1 Tax=Candidatus Lokiarchaeum ossiferum TaxID=2951803 RepID=UPI00352C73AC